MGSGAMAASLRVRDFVTPAHQPEPTPLVIKERGIGKEEELQQAGAPSLQEGSLERKGGAGSEVVIVTKVNLVRSCDQAGRASCLLGRKSTNPL